MAPAPQFLQHNYHVVEDGLGIIALGHMTMRQSPPIAKEPGMDPAYSIAASAKHRKRPHVNLEDQNDYQSLLFSSKNNGTHQNGSSLIEVEGKNATSAVSSKHHKQKDVMNESYGEFSHVSD